MHYIAVECAGPELCTVDICTCKSELLRRSRKLFAFGNRRYTIDSVLARHLIHEKARPPQQHCRVYIIHDKYTMHKRLMGNQYDPRYDAVLYLGLPDGVRDHDEFFANTSPVGFGPFTYGWRVPTEPPGAWKTAYRQ